MSRPVSYLLIIAFLIFTITKNTQGRPGFGGTEQDWGFVTVRPDVKLFWWLYYTTAPVTNYTEVPLLIWIQGGPGMPSSGYGNFLEIGPLDLNLETRNHSWVKDFNVMFIDCPVGVGFSYIENEDKVNGSNKYNTKDEEMGVDLVKLMETFLKEHPEFKKVPVFIFGESYGGKKVLHFAYELIKKIKNNETECDLQAIGLGDAYVSPIDCIKTFAVVNYNLGLIDKSSYEDLGTEVELFIQMYNHEFYEAAFAQDARIFANLINALGGVDIYNFGAPTNESVKFDFPATLWKGKDEMTDLLNQKVKPFLDIPSEVEWSHNVESISEYLKTDFVKSSTDVVEKILNETDVKVIVYNGVMDLVVTTLGTATWIDNLRWNHSGAWSSVEKKHITVNGVTEGYVKEKCNLAFYVLYRAGHSVPIDNPVAMDHIFSTLLKTRTTDDEQC